MKVELELNSFGHCFSEYSFFNILMYITLAMLLFVLLCCISFFSNRSSMDKIADKTGVFYASEWSISITLEM